MLSDAVQRLFAVLNDLAAPAPHDLVAALDVLPEPGLLPSPWHTWTLVGLARHLARQEWVLSVVRARLRADPDQLARAGAFAHPGEIPQDGPVPDLPGWHYMFHGSGCCLVHESGESIDVDFDDDTAEHFDIYFYAGHLHSLKTPDVPEDRLKRLCPDLELLALAIEELQAAGVLVRGSHRVYFRLGPDLRAAIPAIDHLARLLADEPRRCWLAARLGDWPWAHELATDPAVRAALAPRAAACLALRRAHLERGLAADDDRVTRIALAGLAALEVPDLADHLLAALATPTGHASLALELLAPRWQPGFADPVYAFLTRLDPRGPIPQPHLFSAAAALLLENRCRVDDVLVRLDAAGDQADVALLVQALALRAPVALTLLRRALRSTGAYIRNQAAALLAALDLPWTRRELRQLLDSDDHEATSEARAALRRSRDPAAHAAVAAWDLLHPYTVPDDPPYTGLDIHLYNCDDFLAEAIDDQADLVAAHRDHLTDPDPSRWS
jgi:hypothetical protein